MFDYDVKICSVKMDPKKSKWNWILFQGGYYQISRVLPFQFFCSFWHKLLFLKYNRSIFRNWPIDQLHISLLSRNFFFHDLSTIILQKQYCRFLEKRALKIIEEEIKFHQSCKFHWIGENLYTLGKISTLNDDPNDYPKFLLTSLEDDYCWKLGPDISKNLKPDFVAPKLHQTREL